ncbi:MAG: hypothetical protein ACJA2Q_001204 [Pseudohongiellaceae bacterium]|jgi:hypothetical protein
MLSKGAGFANFSRGLCWVVSLIWLALAVLSFTGESDNSTINGLLWLAGAIAFAASALFLGRGGEASNSAGSSKQQA